MKSLFFVLVSLVALGLGACNQNNLPTTMLHDLVITGSNIDSATVNGVAVVVVDGNFTYEVEYPGGQLIDIRALSGSASKQVHDPNPHANPHADHDGSVGSLVTLAIDGPVSLTAAVSPGTPEGTLMEIKL